jgi:hypothetical protein
MLERKNERETEGEIEKERGNVLSLPFLDVYSCLLSNGTARLEIK